MMTIDATQTTAGSSPVECPVRPQAWIGVGCVTGQPVFALDDEMRSEACAPWVPLYGTSAVEAMVNKYADDERRQCELRWSSRVDGLTAHLREVDARYMALLKAVADGVAMQPRTVVLSVGPEAHKQCPNKRGGICGKAGPCLSPACGG